MTKLALSLKGGHAKKESPMKRITTIAVSTFAIAIIVAVSVLTSAESTTAANFETLSLKDMQVMYGSAYGEGYLCHNQWHDCTATAASPPEDCTGEWINGFCEYTGGAGVYCNVHKASTQCADPDCITKTDVWYCTSY